MFWISTLIVEGTWDKMWLFRKNVFSLKQFLHICWQFFDTLFFLFQRRAAAAVRFGSRPCRPQSCSRRRTSPPLPCVTRRGAVMTASWGSTPSLTTSSSHTNYRSIINRRLSTTRHPWITSTLPSRSAMSHFSLLKHMLEFECRYHLSQTWRPKNVFRTINTTKLG